MRTLWTIDKVCCVKDSLLFLSFKDAMFTRYFHEKVSLKVSLFPPKFSYSGRGTLQISFNSWSPKKAGIMMNLFTKGEFKMM